MSDELEKVFDDFADAAEKSLLGFREEIRSLRAELEQFKTETRSAPVIQPPTQIAEPTPGKDGIGVAGASIREGRLFLRYTDGREDDLGQVVGKDGERGKDAEPAKDGKDAVGILNAEIRGANLILELTNGQKQDVGRVVGKDGENGIAKDGKDGVGIAEVAKRNGELIVRLSDNTERNLGRIEPIDGTPGEKGERGADGIATREEIESLVTEQVESRFADVQVRTFADSYRGVYKPEETYARGEFSTWGGSLFLAKSETKARPGESPDWQLIVKRGADARR